MWGHLCGGEGGRCVLGRVCVCVYPCVCVCVLMVSVLVAGPLLPYPCLLGLVSCFFPSISLLRLLPYIQLSSTISFPSDLLSFTLQLRSFIAFLSLNPS